MNRVSAAVGILILFGLPALGSPTLPFERFDSPSIPMSGQVPASIDVQSAMAHIRYLSGTLGPRPAGSSSERAAGDYVAKSLRDAGGEVSFQTVGLPGRRTSRNVIGVVRGARNTTRKIIIGAHYDSRPRSPGANDNASGMAVMLELARAVPKGAMPYTIVFIGFGAEEYAYGDHHYGSRQFVAARSEQELRNMIAMVSIDMAGAGARFQIGNCGSRKRETIGQLRHFAQLSGAYAQYFVNCGSDHEPFERRGVPVAHMRWYPDPNYHRPTDIPSRISLNKVGITGSTVLRWLNHLASTNQL